MQYVKGDFTLVPNIHALEGLKPSVQVLFVHICKYSDSNGECFPSRARLAKDCGINIKTLDRDMVELIEIGLIKKIARKSSDSKKNETNIYQIQIGGRDTTGIGVASQDTQGGDIYDPRGSVTSGTVTIPNINYNQLTIIAEASSAVSGDKSSEIDALKKQLSDLEKVPNVSDNSKVTYVIGAFKDSLPNLQTTETWFKIRTHRESCVALYDLFGIDNIKSRLSRLKNNVERDRFNFTVTTPTELLRKWDAQTESLKRIENESKPVFRQGGFYVPKNN